MSQANPLSKAYRYDPRAWPQEAQDLIRPLISPTVPLTETQIGDFIEALVDDWRARQPDEFWDEMELLAEVQKHTRRDAKDNRIKVELRKYVGREVADITQVGPPGYLSSKIKTIRWLLQMSLSRPYLIRSEFDQLQKARPGLMSQSVMELSSESQCLHTLPQGMNLMAIPTTEGSLSEALL